MIAVRGVCPDHGDVPVVYEADAWRCCGCGVAAIIDSIATIYVVFPGSRITGLRLKPKDEAP